MVFVVSLAKHRGAKTAILLNNMITKWDIREKLPSVAIDSVAELFICVAVLLSRTFGR